MEFNSKELKQKTKKDLKGKWIFSVFIQLFRFIVPFAMTIIIVSSINLSSSSDSLVMFYVVFYIANYLLMAALNYGVINNTIKLSKGDKVCIKDLWICFSSRGITLLGHSIIMQIKLILWSMLLYIPGFIKFFEYFATPYLLIENENMTSKESFIVSKKITNGHKVELFFLHLSLLGWFILTVVLGYLLMLIMMFIIIYSTYNIFLSICVMIIFVFLFAIIVSTFNLYYQLTLTNAYMFLKNNYDSENSLSIDDEVIDTPISVENIEATDPI